MSSARSCLRWAWPRAATGTRGTRSPGARQRSMPLPGKPWRGHPGPVAAPTATGASRRGPTRAASREGASASGPSAASWERRAWSRGWRGEGGATAPMGAGSPGRPTSRPRDERGRRDLGAAPPDGRWVTDAAGSRIPAGKACLSPIAGRLDGMPPGRAVPASPDAEAADPSPPGACEWPHGGDRTAARPDGGSRHRRPGRVGICEADGLAGSMPGKGARPRRREVRGLLRPPQDRVLLRVRLERGYDRRVHENARRVPEVVQGRQDQERPRL